MSFTGESLSTWIAIQDPGAASMNYIGLRTDHSACFSFLAISEGANTDVPYSSGSFTSVEVQMADSVYSNYWSQSQTQ